MRSRLSLALALAVFSASVSAQQVCAPGATCVQMLPPDFLNLSVEDAVAIGGAIISVWAVAWGFRAISRQLWLSMRHEETE